MREAEAESTRRRQGLLVSREELKAGTQAGKFQLGRGKMKLLSFRNAMKRPAQALSLEIASIKS
jgi:hypothetical protein